MCRGGGGRGAELVLVASVTFFPCACVNQNNTAPDRFTCRTVVGRRGEGRRRSHLCCFATTIPPTDDPFLRNPSLPFRALNLPNKTTVRTSTGAHYFGSETARTREKKRERKWKAKAMYLHRSRSPLPNVWLATIHGGRRTPGWFLVVRGCNVLYVRASYS